MLALGAASVGAEAPIDPALPVEAPLPGADPEPPVATAEPDVADAVSPDEAAADGLEPPPTLPVHAGASDKKAAYAAKVENVGRRFHIMGAAPGNLKPGRIPADSSIVRAPCVWESESRQSQIRRQAPRPLRVEHDVVVVEVERLVRMPIVKAKPEERVAPD